MGATSLDDLEDALGRLLMRGNRVRLLQAALDAAPPGLDRGEYAVLSGLARNGPATSVSLAGTIGLDRTGTSRYADRLVAAGLVSRRPDPLDRRAVRLALTPKGRRAVHAMRASLGRHLAEVTSELDAGERDVLVKGLRLLADPRVGASPTSRSGT